MTNMLNDKAELKQKFQNAKKKEPKLNKTSRVFQDYITSMSRQIKNKNSSSLLCGYCAPDSKTRFAINDRFLEAFRSLSFRQKILLYSETIDYGQKYMQNNREIQANFKSDQSQELTIRFDILIESGFRSWAQADLKITRFKVEQKGMMSFDLRNYLLRKSKKTGVSAYVLQAINQIQPKVLRFQFKNPKQQAIYLPMLKKIVGKGHQQNIRRMIKKNETSNLKIPSNIDNVVNNLSPQEDEENESLDKKSFDQEKVESEKFKEELSEKFEPPFLNEKMMKRTSQALISPKKAEESENFDEKRAVRNVFKMQKKKTKKRPCKNVYNLMFPKKNLIEIINLNSYVQLSQTQEKYKAVIYSRRNLLQNPLGLASFKVTLESPFTHQSIVQCLLNIGSYSEWHPQIKSSKIGVVIDSQNCLTVHQIIKQSQYLHQQIEFVYLLHCFQYRQSSYIVFKSIEDDESTIYRRGFIEYGAWMITPQYNSTLLKMEIKLKFNNNQKDSKNHAIIQYLNGFSKLNDYLLQKKNLQFNNLLKTDWNIDASFGDSLYQKEYSQENVRSQEFGECSQISDMFYSISMSNQSIYIDDSFEKQNELDQIVQKPKENIIQPLLINQAKEIQITKTFSVNLNSQGRIILPKEYLRHRFTLGKSSSISGYQKMKSQFKHYLFKDHWIEDNDGDLFLHNQSIKAKQNDVFKHILKKIKENFFQGKSITNISLPVTIFKADSNLDRLCQSWSFGPTFLQKSAQTNDISQRLKSVVAFAFGGIALYFGCQKPFNPILGETFQGFVAGCPIYGEQISHHPPISSILLLGRGYKVHANLEGKVQVKVNSGAGCNDGLINVDFDDGQKICYNSPKGQMTGMLYGKRTFQFKGYSIFFDVENKMLMELYFEDQSGFFSKNKWKYRSQVQGTAVIVTNQFMNLFVSSGHKTKLSKKYIVKQLFKVSGRWPDEILVDGKIIYNVPEQMPYQFIQQAYPLNSHSNYREDIYYRKIQDLERSQTEKQRLEQLQRGDRKFRQNFKKHKHN